jgi:hypothetical protein
MRKPIVHKIGDGPSVPALNSNARTRCGLVGNVSAREPPYSHLLTKAGSNFKATTRADLITCEKCKNLLAIGTIHARRSR